MPDDDEVEAKDTGRAAFLQTRSTSDTDDEEDDLGGQSGDEILEEEEYPELVSPFDCAFVHEYSDANFLSSK